jgi:7-cyano-7-deazaguanine synthase
MRKGKRSIVTVLLSGGIDSTACVHFYIRQGLRVRTVFVDYGQPASRAESRSARAVSAFYKLAHRTISLRGPKIAIAGEILARNIVLIGAGLMDTGLSASLIALGIHAGTRYFDCSKKFITLCERIFEGYTDGRVRIGAPFLAMNKADVWSYCKRNAVPLNLTWSCESSSTKACGKCLSCKDKETLLARS